MEAENNVLTLKIFFVGQRVIIKLGLEIKHDLSKAMLLQDITNRY